MIRAAILGGGVKNVFEEILVEDLAKREEANCTNILRGKTF